MKKIYIILFFALSLSHTAFTDNLGTIYTSFDIDLTTLSTGSEQDFKVYIDSIRTTSDSVVYAAGECLNEYQSFILSSSSRQLANITESSVSLCTGSPCYRNYYTHSSPADLNRDLIVRACYFLVPDSLDSAYSFSPSRYSFTLRSYRPGNLRISFSERFTTTDFNEWSVVSDTMDITIMGAPLDCVPLESPNCLEVYDITPLAAKGIWHHVMLHDGYQYSINPFASPPPSGTDLDTNYISLLSLAPETNYYLHVRAWVNCESSGRTYSEWTSRSFNTLPQPQTTIKTDPPGLWFSADSAFYDSTTIFFWPYYGSSGPCHWLEAISPQFGEPGGIYFFREWSNGGAFYHCYRVTSTNYTITCHFDSISAKFISQTPPPPQVCAGSIIPVTVTMQNTGNLDWTSWENIKLTSQNPPLNTTWSISEVAIDGEIVEPGDTHTFAFNIIAPSTPGDYTFQWQMRYGSLSFFGEKTDSVNILVVESPLATASNDGPHCEGDSSTLFGSPDGMIEYSWTGPSGFTSTAQNPPLGISTPAMSGVYRLIVRNASDCLDTATTTLAINTRPIATASNTGPYCSTSSIHLSSTPSGMASYSWSGPRGWLSSAQNPIILDPDSSFTGTYSVIVTSPYSCKDTATTSVIVNPKPEVTATTNAPVCEGEMLEVRVNPAGLTSYNWLFPDSSIRVGRTHFFLPCSADMAGWYSAIGINEFGCADTSTIYVQIDTVIKTLTIESLNADSIEITSGSSTYLHCDVSGWDSSVSYRWEPMTSLTWAYSSEPLAQPETTTVYVVTVIDSQECGFWMVYDSITISVLDEVECRLNLDTLTSDTIVCEGSSFNLYAGATNPFGTVYYTWSPSTYLSSHLVKNPLCAPVDDIVYTVTAWDDSGCADTATVAVIVDEISLDISTDDPRICRGDYLIVNSIIEGGVPPFEYIWSPIEVVFPPESALVSAYPETTTTLRLTVIDSAGCTSGDSLRIIVDSLLTTMSLDISVEDSVILLGEVTRLHADISDPVGSIGYYWSPEILLDVPYLPNPWAEPFESSWFYLTVIDTQGSCIYSISDSIYIRVEDTSACPLQITSMVPRTTICRGDSIPLWVEFDGAVGEVHYMWRPSEFLDEPTHSIPSAFPEWTTWFWVVISDDSCSDSARVLIDIDTLSYSMNILNIIVESDSIDIGDTTEIYALVSDVSGELSVEWTPTEGLSDPDSVFTRAFPHETTIYTIIARDNQLCGVHADTAYITIYVNTWLGCSLSVTATPDDSICPEESALIGANITGANGAVEFSWTPTTGLSSPYERITYASPETTTVYIIRAEDDSSCIDFDSVRVSVKFISNDSLPAGSFCKGDSIPLILSFANGRPPVSWAWTPSIHLSDSTAGDPIFYAESSITYSVMGIDGEGCLLTTEVSLEVDSIIKTLEVLLSPDTNIIVGGLAYLRSEITGVVGDVSFTWSPTLWLDDPSSLFPTARPPSRMVYHFTAMDSQICGVFAIEDSIVVDILPSFECSLEVTPAFSETSICLGDLITLATSTYGATGEVTYNWSPSIYLDDPFAPSPFLTFLDSSTNFIVIASDDSCSDTSSITIHVKNLDLISEDSIVICRGDSHSLVADFTWATEPIEWNWEPSIDLSDPDSFATNAFPDTTTIYTLIATDAFGCIDSKSVTIVVDSVLCTMKVELTASPSSIHLGDSALVTANFEDAIGDISLEWFGPFVSAPDEPIIWVHPVSSSWYKINASDSQPCGDFVIEDSILISIIPDECSLRVEIAPTPPICKGDSVLLTAECSGTYGPVEYEWVPSEGLSTTDSETTIAHPDFTTLYWVHCVDSLNCTDSTNVTVTVIQPPEVEAFSSNDSINSGEPILLIGFPNNPSYSFLWQGPAGFTSNIRCPIIASSDSLNSGWYSLTVSDTFGCSAEDSIWITVYSVDPQPHIYVLPNSIDFYVESIDTTVTTPFLIGNSGNTNLIIEEFGLSSSGSYFSYSPEPPTEIAEETEETLTISFQAVEEGIFVDTLTINSNDLENSSLRICITGEVHIPGSPDISFAPETLDFGPVTIGECSDESTYVINTGDRQLIIYQLDFPRQGLYHTTPQLPDSINPTDGEWFVFEYCPSEASSMHIEVEPITNIYFGNPAILLALGLGIEQAGYSINTEIITPNGDNKNDIFRISHTNPSDSCILTIYSLEGKEIYSSSVLEWDGKVGGRLAPIGTYYYSLACQNARISSGTIALIY
ncbi:choice-of-anchor D domain-containing protein [bacterium]|nr:choice-of-anchor D domain-containing protein [bacterium]